MGSEGPRTPERIGKLTPKDKEFITAILELSDGNKNLLSEEYRLQILNDAAIHFATTKDSSNAPRIGQEELYKALKVLYDEMSKTTPDAVKIASHKNQILDIASRIPSPDPTNLYDFRPKNRNTTNEGKEVHPSREQLELFYEIIEDRIIGPIPGTPAYLLRDIRNAVVNQTDMPQVESEQLEKVCLLLGAIFTEIINGGKEEPISRDVEEIVRLLNSYKEQRKQFISEVEDFIEDTGTELTETQKGFVKSIMTRVLDSNPPQHLDPNSAEANVYENLLHLLDEYKKAPPDRTQIDSIFGLIRGILDEKGIL